MPLGVPRGSYAGHGRLGATKKEKEILTIYVFENLPFGKGV